MLSIITMKNSISSVVSEILTDKQSLTSLYNRIKESNVKPEALTVAVTK